MQHYRSAWLMCQHSQPDFTHTGSKPGIPLADLLFIVAFTRANNVIRADLLNLGLINKLPWSGNRTLGQKQPINDSSSRLCDTSYADDFLLGMLIFDNFTAIQKCRVTFSVIHRHYSAFGFVVNMKKGKSAALFSFRGKGKQQVETQLYNDEHFTIDFEDGRKKLFLHVATEYKHVGCYLQNSCGQAKEFKHRSSAASSSLTLLRRRVFARSALTQRVKSTVSQAVSFGQLYYGKHTASFAGS